jgi:hypothetical protein
MRKILFAVVAAFAFHGVAQACSCSPAESEAEKREQARRIAMNAIAIVEVEPVTPADMKRGIGEIYRIVKVEAGEATLGQIRMARTFGIDQQTGQRWMSATSCDVFPDRRQRVVLMRTGYQPEDGGDIAPIYTTPGKPCGQVLPVKDAPAGRESGGMVPVYSFGGTCDDYALSQPGMMELIRDEARRLKLPLR